MVSSKEAFRKFLATLFSGKISDAEKMLESLKKKLEKEEEKGYYEAIYGIYYSYVNDDMESLVFKLWTDDFIKRSKDRIVEELKDRSSSKFSELPGYYKAWIDFIEMMDKLPTPHKLVKESEQQAS